MAAIASYADRGRVRVAGTIVGYPLHATLVPAKHGTHRLYVNGGMRAGPGALVESRLSQPLSIAPSADSAPPRLQGVNCRTTSPPTRSGG